LLVLERIRQQDTTSVFLELLDTTYNPVLYSGKDSIQANVDFDSLLALSDPDKVLIGKISAVRDSLYYPIVTSIKDGKTKIGYLIRWRLLFAAPQTIEQFSQLIGTRADLYIGNADGSFWTDLMKPVGYLVPDTTQFNIALEYAKDNNKRFLSAIKPIAGTPWLVSVAFPQQLILESANRFLKRMIIAGLLLLVIGIFIAWVMSRNIIQPLNRLTAATTGIPGGNYAAPGLERKDEVGKLARAFNVMTEQVSEARRGLEQKIAETEEMNEQLRELTAHLQNIREEERIHIAREMHDELGQLLTAFKMDIAWLYKRLTNSDDAIKKKLMDTSKLIDDAVTFVRNLSSELRPSVLDDFGLIPALEWHSREFEKRFGIEVDFRADVKELRISSLVATGLFRMFQEALTNVARHAEATKVIVVLRVGKDDLFLSIEDNGKGFVVTDNNRKTLGLLGMKERATKMGGTLDINAAPGIGTSILIAVPLSNKDQQ
jgi:signal transduction histidine kinase